MQKVEPERVQFSGLEKLIPMSLFVRSLSIFQMWMIMYLSLLSIILGDCVREVFLPTQFSLFKTFKNNLR